MFSFGEQQCGNFGVLSAFLSPPADRKPREAPPSQMRVASLGPHSEEVDWIIMMASASKKGEYDGENSMKALLGGETSLLESENRRINDTWSQCSYDSR